MLSVSALVISLIVALLLGGLVGVLLFREDFGGIGVLIPMFWGVSLWVSGWFIVIALHFVAKYW